MRKEAKAAMEWVVRRREVRRERRRVLAVGLVVLAI